MLEQLKNLDVDRISLENAVALAAFGRALRDEYDHRGITDVPDWLTANLKKLGQEIQMRTADSIEKRLTEAKSRLDALIPASERRQQLKEEIAALEKKLGTTA